MEKEMVSELEDRLIAAVLSVLQIGFFFFKWTESQKYVGQYQKDKHLCYGAPAG